MHCLTIPKLKSLYTTYQERTNKQIVHTFRIFSGTDSISI